MCICVRVYIFFFFFLCIYTHNYTHMDAYVYTMYKRMFNMYTVYVCIIMYIYIYIYISHHITPYPWNIKPPSMVPYKRVQFPHKQQWFLGGLVWTWNGIAIPCNSQVKIYQNHELEVFNKIPYQTWNEIHPSGVRRRTTIYCQVVKLQICPWGWRIIEH